MRKKKQNTKTYTKNPFDLDHKVIGEDDLTFNSLPTKLEPAVILPLEIVDNKEARNFTELHKVKYYLERLGDNPHRIALAVGVDVKRAKKLISDVYNIIYAIDGQASAEQRRRIKLRHVAILDRILEEAYTFLEGENGKLSPSEFKQVSEVMFKALANKAKMYGIGDKLIFEQLNVQNNYNLTGGQKSIEVEREKRLLLEQLHEVVKEKSLTAIDIID